MHVTREVARKRQAGRRGEARRGETISCRDDAASSPSNTVPVERRRGANGVLPSIAALLWNYILWQRIRRVYRFFATTHLRRAAVSPYDRFLPRAIHSPPFHFPLHLLLGVFVRHSIHRTTICIGNCRLVRSPLVLSFAFYPTRLLANRPGSAREREDNREI